MDNKLSELKATVPANVKSREAVAAGFVTDNNSGGYFVIECQECGAVYPSQQADGGEPVSDSGDYNDAICPHCGVEDPEECENVGLAWNVQQAKITALLAELEATRKQNQELAKQCGRLGARAAIAERKLATPVRLPTQEIYDDPLSAHLAINDSADAIRAAGFKVEGDE